MYAWLVALLVTPFSPAALASMAVTRFPSKQTWLGRFGRGVGVQATTNPTKILPAKTLDGTYIHIFIYPRSPVRLYFDCLK